MKLTEALRASRTLGQAINRSGLHPILVAEHDERLFQPSKQTIWYAVSAMTNLTARKCFEPIYESHLGLADIELFLRRTDHHPATDTLNPESWEAVR